MGDVASLLFTLAPQFQEQYVRGHNYVLIRCPFHGGGQERTPSCSVSTDKPVFFCHSCQESGHISRLLRHLGLSAPAAKRAVEDAGLSSPKHSAADTAARKYSLNPFRGTHILNEDLLDEYRQAPIRLLDAGFEMATLRHFEVGYDTENFRITFPLRNIYGQLVGVSGRAVLDSMEPRYKIYRHELIRRREFNIPADYTLDSVKEALLWHGHVAQPLLYETPDEALILTEGFKACMWIWQAGYQTTAAIIGAYLSDLHAELIACANVPVCLFLDNNPAGWRGTFFAAERLMAKGVRFVIAAYPDDRGQPDELDPTEVQQALREATTLAEWKKRHDGLVHEVAWKRWLRAVR
jgi:DNA primase